jgi:acyl transferase domain-containing protein/surfactin synthase thioesterase subunit
MTATVTTTDYRSLLARALETIKKLSAEQLRPASMPIAVLGMSCRFPGGGSDPDAFWEFLRSGNDGVIEVPSDRWNAEEVFAPEPAPGKIYVKEAGFLQEDVSLFDARFFGISPREANEMDPQQRLLLEVCWEALEGAAIAPDSIRGSRTGVFVGQISSEYARLPRPQPNGNPYTMTGMMPNITAGRISYVLGCHGPALAIDTACSSSLAAVHLACESLRRGECDLAIAGGVNMMLSPAGFSMLCAMGALSKDGRCKTFSANGDGYGRGEGVGVIVLKRAAEARRDRDPILAVIRASGVNQDGPGSGLTVPNGMAQRDLLRETLQKAELRPSQIGLIEAHGTGTKLGDPIEYDALCEVFGNDSERKLPLMIGSVKSNIGHLEAAAGISGLIKLVLCLQHREIPPNLHLDSVNPKIELNRIPAEIPRTVTPWQAGGQPLISAISAFGFSGTNACVIASEAPLPLPATQEVSEDRPLHVLALSAKSNVALSNLADRYGQLLASSNAPRLADICFTAGTGRSHFQHRLAVVAGNTHTLRDSLAQRAAKLSDNGAKPDHSTPKIAFLIGGVGSHAIGRRLFHSQMVFRNAAQTCDAMLRELTGTGIIDSWTGGSAAAPSVEAFCLQYCLLQMWMDWGVQPRAVLGAGSGELVSACAAGVLDLRAALTLLISGSAPRMVLRKPEIKIFSAMAAGRQTDHASLCDSGFWAQAAATSTRLDAGADELIAQGYNTFVCLGSSEDHGTIARCLTTANEFCVSFLSSDPWPELASGVAALYEAGVEINWTGFDRGYARTRLKLPTYPFQRKRFWIEQAPAGATEIAFPSPAFAVDALAGRLIVAPVSQKLVEFTLPVQAVPDVRDTHGVLHAGYFLELLGRAMQHIFPGSPFIVHQLKFIRPLVLSEDRDNTVMLMFDQRSGQELEFTVHHRGGNESAFERYAHGVVRLDGMRSVGTDGDSETIDRQTQHFAQSYVGTEFYRILAANRRLELGPGVHWISDVWSSESEALARFETPPAIKANRRFAVGVHPGVFDACAQLFHAALPPETPGDMRFMVTEWNEAEWTNHESPRELWCRVTVDRFDTAAEEIHGHFELLTEAGNTIARVGKAVMKGIDAKREQVLQQLAGANTGTAAVQGNSEILRQLCAAAPDSRLGLLENYLGQGFAGLLEMKPSELNANERLSDLGMDSMIAVSAKSQLEAGLGTTIPVAALIEGPSIHDLAALVLPMLKLTAGLCENATEQPQGRTKDDPHTKIVLKTGRSAKVKLFCLPYGGAGASIFRGWQAVVPEEVEVCPILLPGKESRIKEAPFEDIDTCVEVLCKALGTELDRPYAFYGHSAGGLIAYRLACRLNETNGRKPHHLFVGAYSSPTVHPNPLIQLLRCNYAAAGYEDIPAPSQLLTASAAAQVEILRILRSVVELHDDLAQLLLPCCLADLRLVQSFAWDGRRLDLPVTVFHGQHDNVVSEEEMRAWSAVTSGPFTCHVVSGDHLFIRTEEGLASVAKQIGQKLSGLWKNS